MNCDDFLPAMETGGAMARRRARRHAARCPQCAATYARFATVKQQWANPEPLSPRVRQLWSNAATGPEANEASFRLVRPVTRLVVAGGVVAAAAAACVAWALVNRFAGDGHAANRPSPSTTVVRVPQPPTASGTRVTQLAATEELDALSDAVDQLDSELEQLRHDVQRNEARRQVAMTLDRFGKW
jgi:hypothetical protein